MINVLNKHNTLFNFYPSNKRFFFHKNDFNYISKEKQEYYLGNNIFSKKERKNSFKNSNSKNRLIFNSPQKNWDYPNKESTKLRKNIVTTTTSINFWKGKNNNNKFTYDKYFEKNNKNSIVKRNKNDLYKTFNTNELKSEKTSNNPEQKFKVNSKLFELFINDYEKRIKKSLEEIGMNNKEVVNENENNLNKNYNNYELYEKNFYNLPFLNNNDEEKNIKNNYNSDLENLNSNNENDYNGNNNKIFHKDINSNRVQSVDKKRTIKINTYEKKEEKEKNNKKRTLSSSPYTIQTTINRNTNIYFNSSNKSKNKLSYYEIGKIIGKGAYAVVKICKNKITQEKFAMKIYEKKYLNDNIKKKCVAKEIEILKKLNHPNIAKLYDTIITDKYILLIQELVNGISLREYYNTEIRNQKDISEKKLKLLTLIFKQIFSAFDYIHKKNIAHRDIKLENILLTENNEIKIIDFGFGMYNPRNHLQNFFCGTPNYMAPEIIMKKEYDGQMADVWSLGVLIYKLFCADFPFKGKDEKELYKQIIRGKYKIKEYVPDYVKNIIEKTMKVKPGQRITCEEILLSHWLKN